MYILCFGIAWVSVVVVIFLLFFNIKIALILGSVITIIIFAYLIIKGKICEKYKIPQLIEQMETEHKVILHSMACLLKNQECASDKEKKEGKIGILFLLEQREIWMKKIQELMEESVEKE